MLGAQVVPARAAESSFANVFALQSPIFVNFPMQWRLSYPIREKRLISPKKLMAANGAGLVESYHSPRRRSSKFGTGPNTGVNCNPHLHCRPWMRCPGPVESNEKLESLSTAPAQQQREGPRKGAYVCKQTALDDGQDCGGLAGGIRDCHLAAANYARDSCQSQASPWSRMAIPHIHPTAIVAKPPWPGMWAEICVKRESLRLFIAIWSYPWRPTQKAMRW
ncbi:hypothetical protein PG993_000751 [Apiospora rasikravindrae]|uniref:Uncharacterized protein n=1 Tax=Apiospora rasikravindrae TaxID=990691 RepID=A0ABR1U9H6_9PEZI